MRADKSSDSRFGFGNPPIYCADCNVLISPAEPKAFQGKEVRHLLCAEKKRLGKSPSPPVKETKVEPIEDFFDKLNRLIT
jgi:hypothetical protein